MTTTSEKAVSASEQRLADYVIEADAKIARGKARISALHAEIAALEDEVRLAAETMGQQQADAVMNGISPPDTARIRKEIDDRRHRVLDLKFEQASIRDSVTELEALADPKRKELDRIRLRRGAEAGSQYFDSVINDALSLLPKVAAAAALRAGERVSFYSSPERAAKILERGIDDKVRFVEECAAEYARLQAALKLR